MTKPTEKSASPAGVSGTRKAVSMVLLVVALIVFAIELRASLGQSSSVKALSAKSEDGVFKDVSLADVKAMLSLAPSETVIRETEFEKVYQYKWISLLRPLMQQAEPQLFVVTKPSEPDVAMTFFTDPEDASSGFYGNPAPVSRVSGAMFPEETDPNGIPLAPASTPAPAATEDPAATTPADPAPSEDKPQP